MIQYTGDFRGLVETLGKLAEEYKRAEEESRMITERLNALNPMVVNYADNHDFEVQL